MPEILRVEKRSDQCFGVVRVSVSGEVAVLEFGLDQQGFSALKRVLQSWPFENRSAGAYRYFLSGSWSRGDRPGTFTFKVRIEQAGIGRAFDFSGPASLVSNLIWFLELKDLSDAAHLRRLDRSSGGNE